MTEEEALDECVVETECKNFNAYRMIQRIYADFRNRNCNGCMDFIDGICTDSKGHYCVRNTSMEDRYVQKHDTTGEMK